jgi:undecaprenyl pyrophosphate phosphatase UppP
VKIVNDYKRFKRKRILVSIIGFIFGYLIGIPITFLLEQRFFSMLTFMIGLIGSSLALFLGERKMNLPTGDDVKDMEFKENLNPLGIASEKNGKQ